MLRMEDLPEPDFPCTCQPSSTSPISLCSPLFPSARAVNSEDLARSGNLRARVGCSPDSRELCKFSMCARALHNPSPREVGAAYHKQHLLLIPRAFPFLIRHGSEFSASFLLRPYIILRSWTCRSTQNGGLS
jgi:hypothetical protein